MRVNAPASVFNRYKKFAVTLAVGLIGAALASVIELPAAPLLGAMVITAGLGLAGLRMDVPDLLREAGLLVIGVSLGAGFTSEILQQAGELGLSLVLLSVSIVCTLFASSWILVRFWKQDRPTALLASAPGTLSLVLAMAIEGKGNVTTVTCLQSMRLLLLAAFLPLLVRLFGGDGGVQQVSVTLSILPLLLLAGVGILVSLGFKRLNLPAPYLLGGMGVSAIAHIFELVEGMPPNWLMFLGFAIVGMASGARFSTLRLQELSQNFAASLTSVGVAALLAGLFAVLASHALGLPLAQVWVAYAPGGVEAMAAIGLALGFDPAFVALHHLFRISLLIVLLPIVVNVAARRS